MLEPGCSEQVSPLTWGTAGPRPTTTTAVKTTIIANTPQGPYSVALF